MKALYIKSVFLSRKILAHGGGGGIKGEGCQRLFILENDLFSPQKSLIVDQNGKIGQLQKREAPWAGEKPRKAPTLLLPHLSG
jgi:hypothetical protein